MKILNIHGYKGSSENTAKKILDQLGCQVISPALDYDKILPAQVFSDLEIILKQQSPDIITGTSYGGFFAAALCAKYQIPVILVSPCLLPFVHLPRLGCTWDVKNYLPLFAIISNLDKNFTATIIGGKDEIIDTHDFTKNFLDNPYFIIHPEGKHSGATLPLEEFFSRILKKFALKYDLR